MISRLRFVVPAAVGFVTACNVITTSAGANEPIVVQSGTFLEGALPGAPPPDGGATPDGGPQIVDIQTANIAVTQGQVSHNFSGDVTPSSYSIGVRFQDAGTGYWTTPAQGQDPSNTNLTWSFNANFAFDAPLGLQNLLFVAFDSDGNAGTQQSLQICVLPDFPDNFNACEPNLKPPAAVVSLLWNSNADLDLVLRTPDGMLVDPKNPSDLGAGSLDGGIAANPTAVLLDRDSNADCVEDNFRREDAVWQEAPPSGTFLVYANEFSACGTQATTFEIIEYLQVPAPDGKSWSLQQVQNVGGQFLSFQANQNDGEPLYVTSISFP